LWDDVIINQLSTSENWEKEYCSYLSKLKENAIFTNPDFSRTDRRKISDMISTSFVAVALCENFPDLIPLNIYNNGVFDDRGKVRKQHQQSTNTKSYGLLKGHSPLPLDDIALMPNSQRFLKPSDQSQYDLKVDWVKNNFKQLVHPFSNSISGTLLAQVRVLLKVREQLSMNHKEDPHSLLFSNQKLEGFLKSFISALLFHSGGHSLYEFSALFEVETVKNAFKEVGTVNKFNLEYLFLTTNENAFDEALNKTIQYNKRLLSLGELHKNIHDKNIIINNPNDLREEIRTSTFNFTIEYNFFQLLTVDLDQTHLCFRLAQHLQKLVRTNEARIGQEYFSAYRQGTYRHKLLSEDLGQAILNLSQGKTDEAHKVLLAVVKHLEIIQKYNSQSLFKSAVPELKSLKHILNYFDHLIKHDKNMDI
jgi:hypothetical protein